jgi:hypothetical protein
MTLAVLPRHSARTPSSLVVRRKQSTMPSYLRSRRPDLSISSCRRHTSQFEFGKLISRAQSWQLHIRMLERMELPLGAQRTWF